MLPASGPIVSQERVLLEKVVEKNIECHLPTNLNPHPPSQGEEIDDTTIKDGFLSDGFTLVISKKQSKKKNQR